jgi:hypothetical protein
MEISFNVQAEAFVEFTLSWISSPLVSIDDVPLMSNIGASLTSIDILVLLINILVYVHDLSSHIGKVSALHFEHLPPS